MQTKVCTKCGEEKELTEFYKKKDGKFGVASFCKVCANAYYKQYYQENRESLIEYQKHYHQKNRESKLQYHRQYYQKNRESLSGYYRQYRQENREARREQQKQYRQENREYFAEYRKQYYQENRESVIEQQRQYSQSTPQRKISKSIRNRTRKVVRAGKAKKFCGYNDYIGCTPEELVAHLESQFHQCPSTGREMTWDNHGEWHIDHIRPLASFDLLDEGDFMQAHHYTNLQPLWAEENLSKGATWDEET